MRKRSAVELQQRRRHLVLAGHAGGDADVLVEQREAEGTREGARQDTLGEEIHRRVRPAARRIDDVERDVRGHAGLRQRGESFGGAPHVDGEQRVVHRLQRVAGADVAAVDDLLAEGLEHRARALEQRCVAADHHGERPLLRADRPAAHRRVEEADAVLGQARRDAARGRRITRGAIDEQRAACEASQQSVGAVEHLGDVGRHGEAGDRDVGTAGRIRRRGGVARAGRLGEGARALGRAIPDGERDVGSGGEACGHRPADRAEPEEGDGSHARKLIFPACARAFTSAE